MLKSSIEYVPKIVQFIQSLIQRQKSTICIALVWILFYQFLICEVQAQQVAGFTKFTATRSSSIEQVLTHDQGYFVVIRYNGELQFSGVQVPEANSDAIVLVALEPDAMTVQWFIHAQSADNTESVSLAYDTIDKVLYWTGMFWNVLNIEQDFYPLSVGSRGIFYSSVNGMDGSVTWTKIIQGEGLKQASATAVIPGWNNLLTGFFSQTLEIEGETYAAPDGNFMFAALFDKFGSIVSVRTFGRTGTIRPRTAAAHEQGYVIAGTIRGTIYFDNDTLTGGIPDDDMFVMMLHPDGDNPWARQADGAFDKVVTDVFVTDDQILLTGYFMGQFFFREGLVLQTSGLNFDGFAAVYDWQGEALHATRIFGPGNIFPDAINPGNDNWMISGSWDGNLLINSQPVIAPFGTRQGFVIRLDRSLDFKEFTHIQSDGILSDVHYNKNNDKEIVTLNHEADITIGGTGIDTYGNFQGVLIWFDVFTNTSSTFQAPQVRIWPNPFSSDLFIPDIGYDEAIIIDMQGRVASRFMPASQVELSFLLPGKYKFIFLKNGRIQGVAKAIKAD